MKQEIKEMEINGIVYVPKGTETKQAELLDNMPYCIVRTYSAGVFAGYIEKRELQEVTIRNARRLWQWSGAASLSQLAQSGTTDPNNCKFPEQVDSILLLQAIEILNVTEQAKKTIDLVPIWKK